MRKQKAFTLAEVIIVIGIIGMLAEMIIPNLVAQYQKQQYATQLKQTVSQLQTAMRILTVNEGVSKLSDSNILVTENSEDMATFGNRAGEGFFKKYFKIIKNCGTQSPSPCFAKNYTTLNGLYTSSDAITCAYSVIIANGTSLCIRPAESSRPGYFVIDLNGPKKPNKEGRDLFSVSYYYDGTLDDGVSPECRKGIANKCQESQANAAAVREFRYDSLCKNGSNPVYGAGCFGKILNDGWKMDY